MAGTKEVFDSSIGVLVAPGNTEEICDAVVNLCNNRELRNTLGIRGRELVEKRYSWNKLAQQLIDACENLVSRK